MTLELTSVWNIVISTIVLFLTLRYFIRLFNAQEIPKSKTRGLMMFVLASLVSWGSGGMIVWLEGTQPQVEVFT